MDRARGILKSELGLSDEEVEALILVWNDLNQDKDVALGLLELYTRNWLKENDPKSKPLMNRKELFLFTLSQAKYCSKTGRALLVGEWKPHKIITLVLHDFARLGFSPPSFDIVPWQFGKMVKDLETITSELNEDHWIDVKDNPKSFLLLQKGDQKISETIGQIDWWRDELTLLTRLVRYWIIASEKAPKLTKEYSKLIGQEQFSNMDQKAQDLREKVDSVVLPELEKISSEETPPIEESDVFTRTEEIDFHLKVKRRLSTKTFFDPFFSVGTLLRESVQSSDDLFLENGKLTNYAFPPLSEIDPVDVCNYVLTTANKFKARAIVVDRTDHKIIRTFRWTKYGLQTFLYDDEHELVPLDGKAVLSTRSKILLFVSDLSKARALMARLKRFNRNLVIVGLFHKSYDVRDKLRELSGVMVKREPIDLGISWRGDIPDPPFTVEDLLRRAKPERLQLAKQILYSIAFSDYGDFISTSGLPTGVWICQNRLLVEHPSSYQTILQFAADRIGELKPDLLLIHRDAALWRFGGAVAMTLDVPLAKLTTHKSSDSQIEYGSKILSREDLRRVVDGKRVIFVSLFDSFVTKDIIKALFKLRQTGADIQIFVIFDRWELEQKYREFFGVEYALSLAEFWLALPDDKRLLIEKELLYRKKVISEACKGTSPTSILPSCHYYPRLTKKDPKASRDEELTKYC